MHAGDSSLVCSERSGELVARVGVPLADAYLEFLGGRCRPNTVRAAAYDLKVFFEQILGPEHPRILGLRHDLARWTGEAGDPASARDQLSGLLPVIVRVLGPEHPDIPDARHELSLWTARADSAPSAPP